MKLNGECINLKCHVPFVQLKLVGKVRAIEQDKNNTPFFFLLILRIYDLIT